MMDAAPLLARVQMPEQGIFAVRCPDAGVSKGQEVVVNLGYGPDIGTVLGFEAYDPAVHGASVPGYQLVRAKTDDDARTVAANADAAQKLQAELLEAARSLSPDVRILTCAFRWGGRGCSCGMPVRRGGATLRPSRRNLGSG